MTLIGAGITTTSHAHPNVGNKRSSPAAQIALALIVLKSKSVELNIEATLDVLTH
jgi:hypothetical protein